jgi:outer membrane protein, multidrug efflux system
MRMTRWFVSVLGTCGLLFAVTGCVSSLDQPAARSANTELPQSYDSSAAAATANAGAEVSIATQQHWDAFFSDPYLKSLIEEALKNNQELNMQLQEIIITRNEVAARQGEYWPKVSAGGGLGIEKVGGITSQGVSDERNGVAENLPDFHFGLTMSWEVDIWGKLQDAAKAANYRYFASIEAKNFLVTELVADIADSYYELVALDNQLEVLDKNIKLQEDALEIVKLQKLAAKATELAVQKFNAEVIKNKGLRFNLEQQKVAIENHLNFLLARRPQPITRDFAALQGVIPDAISAGLPSELLDNRPDVRRAGMELEATKLDVEVAKANFYPSLSLDAELGYQAFNPLHLLDTPTSLLYNLAGNMTAPLLNRAAITAEYRMANAAQIRAVFFFEQTLLRAFTEVATYLAMIHNLKERYDRQIEQVEILKEAVKVSNLLYRSAHADYMEVLLTQRDVLEAEMELIETRRQRKQAIVNIYRALGGGWRQ